MTRNANAWPVVTVAVVVLALGQVACGDRRKEEEAKAAREAEAARAVEAQRLEAERVSKLAAAFEGFPAKPMGEADRAKFEIMRKQTPAKYREDLESIRKCHLDQLGPALQAAVEKRYAEVAAPAIDCLSAMEASHRRSLANLIDSLGKDGPLPSEREQKIESALMDLVSFALKMSSQVLVVLLDYGPADLRLATFEQIAGKAAGDKDKEGWLASLLRRGYAGETVPASRTKMEARMNELGISLVAATPSPAPSASPAAGS